jgi:hypothetical protein
MRHYPLPSALADGQWSSTPDRVQNPVRGKKPQMPASTRPVEFFAVRVKIIAVRVKFLAVLLKI